MQGVDGFSGFIRSPDGATQHPTERPVNSRVEGSAVVAITLTSDPRSRDRHRIRQNVDSSSTGAGCNAASVPVPSANTDLNI